MTYTYIGTCVASTYEAIHEMLDEAKQITWRTFRKHVPDAREILDSMGATYEGETTNKQIEDSDWIACFKSRHRGKPAMYIAWSGYELIWEGS